MRDVLETIAVERIEDRLDELEGASRHSRTTHDQTGAQKPRGAAGYCLAATQKLQKFRQRRRRRGRGEGEGACRACRPPFAQTAADCALTLRLRFQLKRGTRVKVSQCEVVHTSVRNTRAILVRGERVVAFDRDAPKRVVVTVFDSVEKARNASAIRQPGMISCPCAPGDEAPGEIVGRLTQ